MKVMYGHHRHVSVSDEYLQTVCNWLEEWANEPDSWIIAQFLKKYGIGWSYFKYFLNISPKLHNIFETTIAGLCEKWLFYAMHKDNLPQHMQKIVMKYLRVYDNHAFDMDKEMKKEIAKEEVKATQEYFNDNYAAHQLKGVFDRVYQLNVNKRRGEKTSQ